LNDSDSIISVSIVLNESIENNKVKSTDKRTQKKRNKYRALIKEIKKTNIDEKNEEFSNK